MLFEQCICTSKKLCWKRHYKNFSGRPHLSVSKDQPNDLFKVKLMPSIKDCFGKIKLGHMEQLKFMRGL